ncbi:hypothetical protein [Blastochloris sulfoviridis]|uniref:Uncharacterized protein n=1 Tax=Blastochloris sulfoviridis TaxID=50712 RepID=A0A5M6HQS8_9HYPH|nr:hypothetical protein [Blastochloris sulfoviridis]KAA5598223.1 hypothetical protein F1193_13630 [Blastochloris sulfoviridis]
MVVTVAAVVSIATAAVANDGCARSDPAGAVAPAATWTRHGLEWVWSAPAPHIVDRCRVREQREAGCQEGDVRFGDTAAMRGALDDIDWPPNVRRMMSAAALSDVPEQAYALIDAALHSEGLDGTHRAILLNEKILTALQFRDTSAAKRVLEESGPPGDVPAALLSDRLFFRVLVAEDGATPRDWASVLDELLTEALQKDPSHFSVRVWRLLAWFKGRAARSEDSCPGAIRALSTRALDVSQASACPLLVGHVDHVIARRLESPGLAGSGPDASWRSFVTGLLAHVTRNRPVEAAALGDLARRARAGSCEELMIRELATLGETR